MDHNCWFQSRGPLLLWGQEAIGSEAFAAFMDARGLDVHSVVRDPQFVEAASHDYRLRSDNPLRALSQNNQPIGGLPRGRHAQVGFLEWRRTCLAHHFGSGAVDGSSHNGIEGDPDIA